jgi:hypothetical protein
MVEFQEKLSALCKRYNSKRNVDFSDKEFLALLISYPSLLVAASDNDFDDKEQELLISLAIGLFEEFERVNLTDKTSVYEAKFLMEFNYLIDNSSEWKESFLNFLLLFSNPELQEIQSTIKRMLIDIAEVSAGISEEEQEVIEFINTNYLS